MTNQDPRNTPGPFRGVDEDRSSVGHSRDPYPVDPMPGHMRADIADLDVVVRVGDLMLWPGANYTGGGPLDDKTRRVAVALLQHALQNLADEAQASRTGAKP